MFKKSITAGLFLLFMTFSVSAETSITLDQALQRAEANNLSLASASIDVQGAQRDIDTSWNLFLPSVSLSLSTSGMTPVFQAAETSTIDFTTVPFSTKTVEIPASSQGLSVGLSASFQLNPAVKDQFNSYDVAYQIKKVTYEQARAEIKKSVTQLFYFLLMQEKNIEVQVANLDLAEQRYVETQKKYESGYASDTEVLSSQLAWEQLKPTLQQAKNSYESQLLTLKAMLGEDLSSDIVPVGEIPSINGSLSIGDTSPYLQKTYGIELLDLNAQQVLVNKELAKKQAFYPTLQVTGNYGLSLWNEQYTNTASDSLTYQVALAIPLDGHIKNSRTSVSMQKLDDSLKMLALQREQTIEQMEVQVASQVRSIGEISLQMDLAQKSLALTQQLYDMQSTQYETGFINAVDLEEAQNNLLSAQQGILALQYQYVTALIDLSSTLNIDMKELY